MRQRLYSYSISPWKYLRLRLWCALTGHEWRLNGGCPACSKCWKLM